MTINELESKLQKLDPNLEIVRDRYMKSEVLVIKPDLLAVKGQYFIYDFSNKRFIRNGLLEWFNNNDTFAFDKMQSLLNKYLYGSNDYQTISKEKNGSTMTFEDDISNDSQKKSVLSGLYTKKEVEETIDHVLNEQPTMKNKEQIKRDLIDYLLDHGISYDVSLSHGNIDQIEIKNKSNNTICFIDFTNYKVNRVVLQRVGRVDKKQLGIIAGLYEQILEMLEELKEDNDGK